MFEPQPRYRYLLRVTERASILLNYETYAPPRTSVGKLLSEVQAALDRLVVTPDVTITFEVRRVVE